MFFILKERDHEMQILQEKTKACIRDNQQSLRGVQLWVEV